MQALEVKISKTTKITHLHLNKVLHELLIE